MNLFDFSKVETHISAALQLEQIKQRSSIPALGDISIGCGPKQSVEPHLGSARGLESTQIGAISADKQTTIFVLFFSVLSWSMKTFKIA